MEGPIPKHSFGVCKSCIFVLLAVSCQKFQAYKHIFTSPSFIEKEPKAMWSGNAHIHRMMQVTPASIAYVATQVSYLLVTILILVSHAEIIY